MGKKNLAQARARVEKAGMNSFADEFCFSNRSGSRRCP